MNNVIVVKDLYKNYGDVHAVNGVTFEVEKSSLFAFLGVNGAGKSTTINMICGALQPTSGDIKICDFDIKDNAEEVKRHIGIVFQDSVLDARLTVKENLYSRAALYGLSASETKARIDRVKEEFRLTDFFLRPYGKLSGGQRRRVDIARALINSPDVLFLDEPTTGLDPATRGLVWELIEKQREKGLTVFLTTHYMEEAAKADKVVIIDEGKIKVTGTPDELKNDYSHDVMRLVAPRTDETDKKLSDRGFDFSYVSGAYIVKLRVLTDAVDFLKENDFTDFEILKGNMDDVFLTVTGKKIGENV